MNSGFFGTKRTVHNIEVPHKRGICKERLDSIWVRLNYKPLKTDDVAVHEFFDSLLSNTDPLSSFYFIQDIFNQRFSCFIQSQRLPFQKWCSNPWFLPHRSFLLPTYQKRWETELLVRIQEKTFRKKWIGSGKNISYHLKHLHRRSWRQASSLT